MRKLFLSGVVTVFLLTAQVASANLFVTNLSNGTGSLPIPGNQAWTGQLGDDFTVTMDLTITQIGVFDDDGDGLIGDLTWQLFEISSGALIHSQTVAATGARTPGTTVEDNYVFDTISAVVNLEAGKSYSVVAYGFDNNDKNFNTNFNLGSLDVEFNTYGITGAGGRYSNAPSSTIPTVGASSSPSTQAYNFGAATFSYAPVPEPTTLLLFGTGIAGLAAVGRRRKK